MSETKPDILRIDAFIEKVTRGTALWTEAGALLAEIVAEEGEGVLEEIRIRCPGITHDTLGLFLSIGRRELYPMLAWDDSRGGEALMALAYDEQERLYLEGVTVVRETDAEQYETEILPVGALSHRDCQQVFDGGKVRTVPQQKAYLMRQGRERLERRAAHVKTAPRNRQVVSADTSGFDADAGIVKKSAMTLDQLAAATPKELLVTSLGEAHAALIDARRHLAKIRPNSRHDKHITAALTEVGNLRYAATHDEL